MAITKVMTPDFRVSFPTLFEPKAIGNGTPKYSVTMLFDLEKVKSNPEQQKRLKVMQDLVTTTAKEKWGEVPDDLKKPFRKGEEKAYDGYGEGVMFINCSTQSRPGLVDQDTNPITDRSEFYGGCFARATVNAYAWEYMGKKGVSFGLQNVQKIGEGDHFGGKTRAEDDFDALSTTGGSESDVDEVEEEMFR